MNYVSVHNELFHRQANARCRRAASRPVTYSAVHVPPFVGMKAGVVDTWLGPLLLKGGVARALSGLMGRVATRAVCEAMHLPGLAVQAKRDRARKQSKGGDSC